jgi:hypothetical protein
MCVRSCLFATDVDLPSRRSRQLGFETIKHVRSDDAQGWFRA